MRSVFLLAGFLAFFTVAAQQPKLMLPVGHTGAVTTCRFTPDGKRLITIGSDGKRFLWDVGTSLRLAQLEDSLNVSSDVVFNSDGTLAVGVPRFSYKKGLPLWNLRTGGVEALLQHEGQVRQSVVSPDGQRILTVGYDGKANIWSAKTGEQLLSISTGQSMLDIGLFSADGKLVVTTGLRDIKIWNALTGEAIKSIEAHTDLIGDLVFTPDGKRLISTSDDKTTKVWDVESGALIYQVNLDNEGDKILLNGDGTRMLMQTHSISDGKGVGLWDLTNGKKIATLIDKKDKANVAAFSPNGKLVIYAGEEKGLRVGDAATGKLLHSQPDAYSLGRAALFTPDSKFIILAGNGLKQIDATTGAVVKSFNHNNESANALALSVDGENLAIAWSQSIEIYNLRNNRTIRTITYSNGTEVKNLHLEAEKGILVSNKDNGETKVWSLNTGQLQAAPIYAGSPYMRVYSAGYGKVAQRAKQGERVEIWDLINDRMQCALTGKTGSIIRMRFSPDETLLVSANLDHTIQLWDANTGLAVQTLPSLFTETLDDMIIGADNKRLVAWDWKKQLIVWDLAAQKEIARLSVDVDRWFWLDEKKEALLLSLDDKTILLLEIATGKVIMRLTGGSNHLRQHFTTPDDRKLITVAHYSEEAVLWDLENKKMIARMGGHKGGVMRMALSPDGAYLTTLALLDPDIRIWNAQTGALIKRFTGHTPSNGATLLFSRDSKTLYSSGGDNIYNWSVPQGELLKTFTGLSVSKVFLHPTQPYLFSTTYKGQLLQWNTETGRLHSGTKAHDEMINDLVFLPDGESFFTASADFTIKRWRLKNLSLRNQFFSLPGGQYFNSIPEGYYTSSPGAATQLHYVTPDLQPISFGQLDLMYNRPHRVLQAIGSTDTALIRGYREAYAKRLRRAGTDSITLQKGFQKPTVSWANVDIPTENTTGTITVRLTAKDSLSTLKSLQLWVNESPVYGTKGAVLSGKSNVLDTMVSILLTEGVNKIEYAVRNSNGSESFRIPLSVKYTPTSNPSVRTYFIGIGINRYAQPGHDLQWSVKDIRDLAVRLARKKDGLVVDTLFDAAVTVEAIKALRQKLEGATVHDEVIVAYSGHGVLSKTLDYYLSTYNMDFGAPEGKGLPYETLSNLLDGILPRKKLVLVDACHSGEVDKEDETLQAKVAAAQQMQGVTTKGAGEDAEAPRVGMKNSFELMKHLFADITTQSGATIIAAAGGRQYAQEREDLQNGVFTYAILEFMKNNYTATVQDLQMYINSRVPELTQGMQVPTTRTQTQQYNWKLW